MDGVTPTRRLRLLFLAPFPPDLSGSHGGSRAIASTIDTLARRHEVSVLYLGDANGGALQHPPECNRMIGIDMPIRRRSVGRSWSRVVEFVRLLLGSSPDWVRESWSAEMARACAELAGEMRPDVVHFEFHVMAQYIPVVRKAAPEARCIVTEHEPGVASAGARRQEGRGIRQRLGSWIRRLAWARYEHRTLSQADAVVTFTKKDEEVVRELVGDSSTQVTCIPLRILPERVGSDPPIESDLLFVGAFRHPPNVDAAMRLATVIFPRIREARPAARMAIVGPDPPPQLVRAAGPGIDVTGRVDDLAPYFAGASIFICPLRLGGGMRVKVLEACAFGKALIATPQAVEGLGLRPGIEFTLAASDDEFVARAINLLSDAWRREQLEQAALDWASRTQDPEEWAAQFDSLYGGLAIPACDREAVEGGEVSVRVTLAVATCGRPLALSRCLDAIAAQTRPPDELIVIDQNPLSAARDAARRSALIVDYRTQPKLGLSASRNLALARASGSILAVTDDDCFPDPHWLATLARAFETGPQLAAVTGPIIPPPGDPPAGMCAFSLRLSSGSRLFNRRVIPWHVGSGANFAAKVDWLRRLGGWDERLGVGTPGQAAEDCDIIDRLLVAGGSIRYDADAAVHHEWQPLIRRGATRWSYGYGIGALCGLRLAERDRFGLTMIGSYLRRHLRVFARELVRFNWDEAWQRFTAIVAVVPGLVHGLRADQARSPGS